MHLPTAAVGSFDRVQSLVQWEALSTALKTALGPIEMMMAPVDIDWLTDRMLCRLPELVRFEQMALRRGPIYNRSELELRA